MFNPVKITKCLHFVFLSSPQYIVVIIFALIVGAVYFQLNLGQNGYQNRLNIIV